MANQNLDRFGNRQAAEPKIRTSRDGRWLIIRIPGIEQPIIKAVAYFEAIIRKAKSRISDTAVNVEKIKE